MQETKKNIHLPEMKILPKDKECKNTRQDAIATQIYTEEYRKQKFYICIRKN